MANQKEQFDIFTNQLQQKKSCYLIHKYLKKIKDQIQHLSQAPQGQFSNQNKFKNFDIQYQLLIQNKT
ncbi:unnamed protein product [Paramecium sonneborni]|uniref:Uncharacterized protein n=1 Tax=Paramecium sonneborni TaxID=65129 RepID=A0A8S1M846_9CILI|nr:unnamed protein product [Paramecium sonneborni]